MTTYGGGKARIGKQIYEVIKELQEETGYDNTTYLEPFCGMLGVAKYFIEDNRQKIILNDINKDIILMWNKLKRGGWTLPKKCNREKYTELKYSKKHSAERGFYGTACAYSGIFFAGYRPTSGGRNFFKNSRDNIKKLGESIHKNKRRVKFTSHSYNKFKPKGMTIYCDPPYKNNKFNTEHFNDFDHDLFWETMRKWSRHNLVIISEYTAPKDFKCIWKKQMNSTFGKKMSPRTEKLFIAYRR